MKKNIKRFLGICMATLFLQTAPITTLETFANGSPNVYINQVRVNFEEATRPYINEAGYTLIPFRAVGELLDLSLEWYDPYIIAKGYHAQTGEWLEVTVGVGDLMMAVNEEIVEVSTPVEIRDNRSYIPFRMFAETFGYDVDWRNETIFITDIYDPVDLDGIEYAVFELVNEERRLAGYEPLQFSRQLSDIARVKSDDMYIHNYFSHQGDTYGSPSDLVKFYGVEYQSMGENIAKGQKLAEDVMLSWMNSEGHRDNILKENFDMIGIGYNAEGNLWTQLFLADGNLEPDVVPEAPQEEWGTPEEAPQEEWTPEEAPQEEWVAPEEAPQEEWGTPEEAPQEEWVAPEEAPLLEAPQEEK